MAKSLIEWAAVQPAWVGDCLRRIAIAADHAIGDEDISFITGLLRNNAEFGSIVDKCEVISNFHLGVHPDLNKRAALTQIGPVHNVDRLASDQTLRMAPVGITLVYGENGSGKSGYTRIAKGLCRSLSTDDLRGNVFEITEEAPIVVNIRYQVEGGPIFNVEWVPGQSTPSILRQISVFDSKNARLYVDSQNRIAYLPKEIAILEHHGEVCQRIGDNFLKEEKDLCKRFKAPLPAGYTVGSQVSLLIGRIRPEEDNLPTRAEIEQIAHVSDQEFEELARLEKELAQDPIALATNKRRAVALLKRVSEVLSILEIELVDDLDRQLHLLREELSASAAAVEVLSARQFAGEPLPNTGSDTWRLLYEAACAFVLTEGGVEPGRLPDAEGVPCPMCQEALSHKGADRMRRFNAFIHSEASKRNAVAHNALDLFIKKIGNVNVPLSEVVTASLVSYSDLGEIQAQLVSQIERVIVQFQKRKSDLISMVSIVEESPKVKNLIADIYAEVKVLDIDAQQLEGLAEHAASLDGKRTQLADLKDRIKLSHDLNIVTQRRDEISLLYKIRSCLQELIPSLAEQDSRGVASASRS